MGRPLAVGAGLGVGVGLGVELGVGVAVAVGIGVGVGLGAATQYLPPVLNGPGPCPPQTIIWLPVAWCLTHQANRSSNLTVCSPPFVAQACPSQAARSLFG